MLRRLLDPTPIDGGGAAPAPTAPATNPAPVPTPQPAAPQFVQVPYEQFQRFASLAGQLATAEAERQQSIRTEQEKATAAMLKAGQAEEAVKTVRTQAEAELNTERNARSLIEDRARKYARDTALAIAVSGHKVVPGSAPQLMTLLRAELDAYPEGESFAVRTPQFQSADQLVAAKLALPEFAHFLEPSSRGGVVAGGNQAAPTASPASKPADRLAESLKNALGSHLNGAPGLAGNYGRN